MIGEFGVSIGSKTSRKAGSRPFGTFLTIQSAIAVFRRQGTGGSVVVISTKNVFEPGASFGAYSATKAGAQQLAKIAALELADHGVRVNMINPDAVFGDEKVSSKLWDLVGPLRMKSRGLDAEGLKEYYRQRNLLKTSVLAEHVGNADLFYGRLLGLIRSEPRSVPRELALTLFGLDQELTAIYYTSDDMQFEVFVGAFPPRPRR